ncbi:CHAT domain-containing protein [Cellulomonas chitinilytica]|nr:CHAT domain-containing protein [Cellulomonas chitinilytica]
MAAATRTAVRADVRSASAAGRGDDLRARAEEALRLAGVDPGAATPLASHVAEQARLARDWATVCVAERAAGVAAMQQSRLDVAVERLRAAVAAGRRAGEPTRTGEARMSLAGALLLTGHPGRSLREIDQACAELSGLAAARARVQRAAILQDMGRLDAALDDLRHALRVIRRAGDAQWATRALSNRGLLLVSRRELVAARRDLTEAAALCEAHGLAVAGALVEHNLAWVDAQAGDVPSALDHLDRTTVLFEALGLPLGSVLTDHAELLLSVRLVDEARELAEAAVAANTRDGRERHLPESRLLLSTVALVQSDLDAALDAALTARREFVHLQRREWATLADFASLQALTAADRPVTSARCRRVADALEHAGWIVPALEARLLAGRVEMSAGRTTAARRDFARAGRARHTGPADARARAWLGEALLREAEGRRPAALSALRAGLRVLEDHRATMGATELRAHVSTHRGEIAGTGLRMALEARDPRSALGWSEWTKATATLRRDARPSSDPVLAQLLADLRSTTESIGEDREAGQPTGTLVARQVALERRIRDHCRHASGGDATVRPPTVEALAGLLGDHALVAYLEVAGHMHAVTVVDGRPRLHHLGPAERIRHSVERASFALRRMARGDARPASVEAAGALLAQSCAAIGADVLAPLATAVGDRPLVVVPVGWLQSVPWSALPECADRPVSVSPSATHWHAAASRPASTGGRRAVVAGPGLDGALAEARDIASLHPTAALLVGEDATADAVSRAMDGAALVHVAGHGRLRADNPQFSALMLTDGPFTVYDLERIATAPRHVVLAACETATTAVVAGGEIMGLSAALLAGGTATLVAPVMAIPDIATASLMASYHRELVGGHPPASALRRAQSRTASADPAAAAVAASFVQVGYGGPEN